MEQIHRVADPIQDAQGLTRKDFPELWRDQNPSLETAVRLDSKLGVKAVFFYDSKEEHREKEYLPPAPW